MNIKDIKRIAVIGAGLMGSQIAELFSHLCAYDIHMVDVTNDLAKRGLKNIEGRLERFFVSKGRLTIKEKEEILARIKVGTSLEDAVKKVDFVIEAVAESLNLKSDIFKKVDDYAPHYAIIASNTSFLNISAMAMNTKRPGKVIGMHFFNPVAIMKLVEIVRGARTSDETVEIVCSLAEKLEKEPVVCRDTSYGFLANRAYSAMMREVMEMLWERVASPEEIDKALRLGYSLPIGPCKLMDFTGSWSIFVASEKDSMRELGPEKGRLHPLVRAMARAGYDKIYDFWTDILSKW